MHLLRNEPDVYVAGDLNTKSPNDTNVSLRPFEKMEKNITIATAFDTRSATFF
jgi:hypothetical protein